MFWKLYQPNDDHCCWWTLVANFGRFSDFTLAKVTTLLRCSVHFVYIIEFLLNVLFQPRNQFYSGWIISGRSEKNQFVCQSYSLLNAPLEIRTFSTDVRPFSSESSSQWARISQTQNCCCTGTFTTRFSLASGCLWNNNWNF